MAVTKILVYITCLCFARDFVFCDDYEEIGNEITLTPSIRGKPEEILWKHNENKVLEYDGSEVVEYGSFRGRVVVDFETGQLTIQKLNSQDSGQYQSDIVINGKIQSSSHTLTVLDALAEPQVSCELDETSNVKKLVCSVESQTPLSYEWSGPNINGHSGPELVVDKQEENLDSVYNCTVKNHVNSKSTEFTLKDCHTGREGSAVLVPVLIVAILLILLIALAIFLYILYRRKKQKQTRPSESKNMDPENGESEKLLKETNSLQEQNLKQSPQSDVTETNQENTGKGDEGELKYEKNSKNTVEAEGNTYSKPDETEKERHKPLESQEEEEKEKSQILKQESENGEKSPEHQNETLEEQKTEDNNRPDTGSSDATLHSHTRLEDSGETDGQKTKKMSEQNLKQSPQSVSETNQENTGNGNEGEVDKNISENADETGKESHKPSQSQKEEKKEKSQIAKQKSENGERSPQHQNEGQKTEDNNEDNQTPAQTNRSDTESGSPQSDEQNNSGDRINEAEQVHGNEKESQNDDGGHQNESQRNQKTEDAANSENDMRPGETKERSEEKNHEGIDGSNTAETGRRPSVDQPVDGEAPSGSAGSSDATLHSHTRLEDSGETDGQKTKKMSEQNLKQSPQSVSETNQENTGNGNEGEVDKNISENADETGKESHKPSQSQKEEKKEKSQIPKQKSENGERSPQHQNEGQKTEDNNEDNQTPAQTEEVIRPDTVIDTPANLEKDPINSSVASSSQPDLCKNTDQDKEEERKHPGLDQDEKGTVATNQEEKGGQEQMAEEKNHDKQDKQTDCAINTVSQEQGHDVKNEAVLACSQKSDMTDKDQSFTLNDNNAEVMQNEGKTEVQIKAEHGGQTGHLTEEEDGGDSGHRDKSSEPE